MVWSGVAGLWGWGWKYTGYSVYFWAEGESGCKVSSAPAQLSPVFPPSRHDHVQRQASQPEMWVWVCVTHWQRVFVPGGRFDISLILAFLIVTSHLTLSVPSETCPLWVVIFLASSCEHTDWWQSVAQSRSVVTGSKSVSLISYLFCVNLCICILREREVNWLLFLNCEIALRATRLRIKKRRNVSCFLSFTYVLSVIVNQITIVDQAFAFAILTLCKSTWWLQSKKSLCECCHAQTGR